MHNLPPNVTTLELEPLDDIFFEEALDFHEMSVEDYDALTAIEQSRILETYKEFSTEGDYDL